MNTVLVRLCTIGLLALCLATSRGEESPVASPSAGQEQYDKLKSEYDAAQTKFGEAYGQAKTDEERKKVVSTLYPRPANYTARFVEIAHKYSGSPAALDALVWVAKSARGERAAQSEAIETLQADYLQSDKLDRVCPALIYAGLPKAESFMRAVLEKNPHRQVQASACLSLARSLRDRNPAESEKFYARAASDYADVPTSGQHTTGEEAQSALFEMRGLAVGQVAPEIVGKDVDGKEIKLSDYRGKVVVLDFWGRW